MKTPVYLVSLFCITAALSTCGGDSGSNQPGDDATAINGVLIVPDQPDASTAKLILAQELPLLQRMAEDCPGIPDGYIALSNAEITYIDDTGSTIGSTFSSDECGRFSGTPPTTATGVRAVSPGYRPIETDISNFQSADGEPGLASTISTTASYRISAIQKISNDSLAFTITDTETNQAVLGMPASAFAILLDGSGVTISSLDVAASTTSAASTVLTLDASRSMDEDAYTDPDTGRQYDRNQLATLAAHTFLDQKGDSDEVAALLFSGRLFFMDQLAVDNELPLIDVDGNSVQYQLSDDGFVTDARRLRFVIDAYNQHSDLYSSGIDVRHLDTPQNVTIGNTYPFVGATAFYDAVAESVVRLDERNVVRPVVIAMTDGEDNRSGRGIQQIINAAIAASVPVYTIGFGGDTEEDLLTQIADDTGGSFFSVTSIDIANVYQGIQSGILFQYVATVNGGGIDDAFTLGVTLDYNGLQTDRQLTITP